METIKTTVDNIIRDLCVKKEGASKINSSEEVLKNALTKKALAHIKFNYFKRGIFSINVDSSPWLYKLSLQKESLLVKLKKEISSVKDIRFHIGAIR